MVHFRRRALTTAAAVSLMAVVVVLPGYVAAYRFSLPCRRTVLSPFTVIEPVIGDGRFAHVIQPQPRWLWIFAFPLWCVWLPSLIFPALWMKRWQRQREQPQGFNIEAFSV